MSIFRHYLVAGMFLIIQTGFAQVVNDNCAGAITINSVQGWCSSEGEYTNQGATLSSTIKPVCWSNLSHDVWFKFTAVASALNIKVIGNGTSPLVRPEIQIHETCTRQPPACASAPAGSNTAEVFLGSMTPGNTYWIRIDGVGNSTGTFQLCVDNTDPPDTPGQDCISATHLCNKNSFSVPFVSGGGVYELGGTCKSTENNSTWYTWTAKTSGTLTFEITPNNAKADLDMVFYELPGGNCAGKVPLRCTSVGSVNPSSPCAGSTGLSLSSTDISEGGSCRPGYDNHVKYLDATEFQPGKTYALVVTNFNSTSGFKIDFGGSGEFEGPVADFDVEPNVICDPSVAFEADFTDLSQNADSYEWDFGDGATPATSNAAGPHQVSYNGPGTKTITLKIVGGSCTDVITKDITIPDCVIDTPEVVANVADSAVCGPVCTDACVANCTDISASITGGTPPYTVVWDSDKIPDGEGPHQACPLQTSTYVVTITDQNGLSAKDSVTVEVIPLPDLDFTGRTVCIGKSTVIENNSTSFDTIYWEFGDGGNSNDDEPVYQYADTGIYNVTLIGGNQGCLDTLVGPVEVLPGPIAGFTADTLSGCSPLTVTFMDTSKWTTVYSWDFGDGGTSTEKEPTHIFTDTGHYDVSLIVGSDQRCADTMLLSEYITVYGQPVADFSFVPSNPTINDTELDFTNTSINSDSWIWDFGDGDSAKTHNPSHAYQDTGLYEITLIAEAGQECSDTLKKYVYIRDIFRIYVPDAFTPNRDKKNDTFFPYISNFDESSFEMYIYNRWGEMIYSTDKITRHWDGRIENKGPAPEDVYVWLIKVKDMLEKRYQFVGHVTLVR